MTFLTLLRESPISARIGIGMILINVLAAIFAPLIAPYGETEIVGDVWAPNSSDHWLGTDQLGRDLLTRLVYGARNTIAIAFAYWLFFQAYFVIGAMCPWCPLITFTTLFVFTSMTRINILEGNFGPGVRRRLEPALRYGLDIYGSILISAVIAAMVIVKYV